MPRHQVVIVGAGLAGLTCAVELTRRGVEVVVLEAGDGVGGRVRTDRVDGMLLDRGFQLLNPAYPALRGLVDLEALDLCAFGAGVVVAAGGTRSVLADPRRSIGDVGAAFDSSTGSLFEKARFVRYLAGVSFGSGQRVKRRRDEAYGRVLDASGVTGRLRTAVLEPFLAGVLAEDRGESSRVFVDLQLRMFARGTPGLPAAGMQALPEQLAAALPPGVVHLETEATAVSAHAVSTSDGSWPGDAVVVATDGVAAGALTGLPVPPVRGLTTFYHRAPHSPASRPLLHVDGDRSGPVVNTAVVSDVAPRYCPDGALVSSTILGAHGDGAEAAVASQLARIYGVSTGEWELMATYAIPHALPAMLPPLDLRQPVRLADGVFVAGDHRDTASIQGAIVSGRRAAKAVLGSLDLGSRAAER
jgi:glycine/D-amino acid oxidase-like deaminating enzyme